MKKARIVLLGYEHDRLELYGAILEDEGYEVYLLYPDEENIRMMSILMPQMVLVDVTEVSCDVEPVLFPWLREHANIAVLFCMDRYLEAIDVLNYVEENQASLYATFLFNLDDFVAKVVQTLAPPFFPLTSLLC